MSSNTREPNGEVWPFRSAPSSIAQHGWRIYRISG